MLKGCMLIPKESLTKHEAELRVAFFGNHCPLIPTLFRRRSDLIEIMGKNDAQPITSACRHPHN